LNEVSKHTVAVIGGDTRQVFLAQQLADEGHRVNTWALERYSSQKGVCICDSPEDACRNAEVVALPMPIAREGAMLNCPLSARSHELSEVFGAIAPGTLTVAGSVKDDILEMASKRNIKLVDYIKREDLALSNAEITAEGAIQKAMELLPVTINGCNVLIIGNGRIGRQTAMKMRLIGARTAVAARSSSALALAAAEGHIPVRIASMDAYLYDFRLRINTVPAPILTAPRLRKLSKNALIIDLASAPGGVDFAAAAELGIQTEWALSLPGKAAPETSGLIIKNVIQAIMEEEGIF